MSHIAWSVCVSVCVSVCLLGTRMSCAKTAKPIKVALRGQTCVSPRNHILDRIQIPTGRGTFEGTYSGR